VGRRSAQIPSMIYFKKNYKSPSYLYQKYYEMSMFLKKEMALFHEKSQNCYDFYTRVILGLSEYRLEAARSQLFVPAMERDFEAYTVHVLTVMF